MNRLGDFYTVEAAAVATGLKYKTLLQRIARGRVICTKFGRMKLVPTSEVERLMREQGR